MPRPRSAVPGYLLHKPTNQAYVILRTETGDRRIIYLGAYNSPESRTEYARLIAGGPVIAVKSDAKPAHAITVVEVLLKFAQFAETYYVGPDGRPTSELAEYRLASRGVRELFGSLPAVEFGPKKLASVRQRWIDDGLTRGDVNRRVGKVKRIFRWAAQEELIPASVSVTLNTLIGLSKGRTSAPDPEPVTPVDSADVEATLPHVLPEVAGMIQVQQLTGMRPGEVCRLRPADIDADGAVWIYRPQYHKNSHRGKDRVITIGPRAQSILLEFWPDSASDYIFSPRRAMARIRASRSEQRVTPRYPSHIRRNEMKRKATPEVIPAERYVTASYRRAIDRGIEKANVAREQSNVADPLHGPNRPPVPHWHPNQLRHTHATDVRRRYGLEAAQVVLGHSRADVTQLYAEKNLDLAARVAAEVG